jgi:hypothetical protein
MSIVRVNNNSVIKQSGVISQNDQTKNLRDTIHKWEKRAEKIDKFIKGPKYTIPLVAAGTLIGSAFTPIGALVGGLFAFAVIGLLMIVKKIIGVYVGFLSKDQASFNNHEKYNKLLQNEELIESEKRLLEHGEKMRIHKDNLEAFKNLDEEFTYEFDTTRPIELNRAKTMEIEEEDDMIEDEDDMIEDIVQDVNAEGFLAPRRTFEQFCAER